MKKRMMLVLLAVLLLCSNVAAPVAAAQDTATVYVTIADANGELALALEPVTVTDIDGDGTLTVNDALYIAHEERFDGGAAAGYGAVAGDYGLSMTKLWGVANGGSYGYYINNASAYSLTDAVRDGDCVNAFVYTAADWSDTYCWFDVHTVETIEGTAVTLTLSAAGYDDAWNSIVTPVCEAVITVDGVKTAHITDENGRVTLSLAAGDHVISAVSAIQTLVPPVCKASVSVQTPSLDVDNPDTSDSAPVAALLLMAAAAVFVVALAVKRGGVYET